MSDTEEKDYEEINDKEKDFDPINYIKGLVNVCKYTFNLSDRENGKIRKGRQNLVYTMLLNFEKELDKYEFEDFEDTFLRIFIKNRKDILSDESDNWLMNGDIKIDLPRHKVKSKKERGAIFLSTIYSKAAAMWDAHKTDPLDKDGNYSEYVLLPLRFFRYLYLILLETDIEGKEIDKISDYLDKTDTQLKITDNTYMENFSMGLFGGGFQESLKSIIKTLMSTAGENGAFGSEGEFDIDKLIEAMMKIFTDSNTMSDLTKEISGTTDKKQIISVLIKKLNNPQLLEAVEKATGMKIDPSQIEDAIGGNSEMNEKIGDALDKFLPLLNPGKK
jgi:hypothetical protein